jgi:hypothetical protein
VKNPKCERFPADRADAAAFQGIDRMKAHVAFAVTIVVVFAFLGVKLHGAFEAAAVRHGRANTVIVERNVEEVGLPTQFFGGMGI